MSSMMAPLTRLVGRPSPVAIARVVTVATVIAFICWYCGTDVWHAILFGAAITTLGFSVLQATGPSSAEDRWLRDTHVYQSGSRHDIAELSALLRGRWGLVRVGAVWRVQRIAQRRLEPYDLDLSDPADRDAIRALLGRRAASVLTRVSEKSLPTRGALLHCLDMLDSLNEGRLAAAKDLPRRTTSQADTRRRTTKPPRLRRIHGR